MNNAHNKVSKTFVFFLPVRPVLAFSDFYTLSWPFYLAQLSKPNDDGLERGAGACAAGLSFKLL